MRTEPMTGEGKTRFFHNKKGKVITVIVAALAVLIVTGLVFAQWFISKSHPDLDGAVVQAPVSAEVKVIRDDRGVAQIKAGKMEDLFFTQGYVMAQDRLFQMDMTRRLAGGRLAEVVGEAALDSDKFFRTYGMHRSADGLIAEFNSETASMVDAFASGVNAYINEAFENNEQPLEFRILDYKPEPWTAEDTAIAVKYMGYTLTGNFRQELENYQLVKMFGEEAVHLFPEYHISDDFPVIDGESGGSARKNRIDAALSAYAPLANEPVFKPEDFNKITAFAPDEWNGSNNWAISGEYTDSGYPLIADDPHLGLAIPSVWYQTHLELEDDFHSIGVTVPGIPGVVLGHNGHVSWGVTSLAADYEDIFLEQVNPENPNEYLFDSEWEEAELIEEEIYIDGKDRPYIHRVEVTRNGPIMNKVTEDGPYQAFSLRWSGMEPGGELNGILRLNRSTDANEFMDGLDGFVTPGLSWVFADTDGNIGFRGQALIPVRPQSDGRFPVPGWDPDYQWDGFIPAEDLPEIMNPDSGYIVTANNKPAGEDYEYDIGRSFYPYRAVRLTEIIEEQLASGKPFTLEDMGKMQSDFKNTQARDLLPLLVEAVETWDPSSHSAENLEGKELGPLSETELETLELLKDWDFIESTDSPEALVWQLWYSSLPQHLFHRYLDIELSNSLTIHRVITEAAQHEDSLIFGFLEEDWHVPFPKAARETFYEAVEMAKELQGNQPGSWAWGERHQLEFDHPLGSVWPLQLFFNLGSWETGGSGATPGAMGYDTETGITNHAAGWRFIGDLSSVNGFFDVMVPGQSGQWRSPHYDDQIDTWVEGGYYPMIYDKAERNDMNRVVFIPEEAGAE
ncbi:penicillin acylase family protein [Salipaludibacillus sp. CUR1]|uniref:penicillin acylase family protein n=1 Tax=Salipaludibacillus sp. CUR1 TaxID=2820003 RepID=UPI001E311B93|nr:penicillin acylase family protein [Salipaludibacillus sp. CUR1]